MFLSSAQVVCDCNKYMMLMTMMTIWWGLPNKITGTEKLTGSSLLRLKS